VLHRDQAEAALPYYSALNLAEVLFMNFRQGGLRWLLQPEAVCGGQVSLIPVFAGIWAGSS
jgi:hypothetical protein